MTFILQHYKILACVYAVLPVILLPLLLHSYHYRVNVYQATFVLTIFWVSSLVLTQAVVKSPVGGDYISNQCRNFLEDKGIDVVPPYLVASKEVTKPDEPPNWKRKTSLPKFTESWHNYMIKVTCQKNQK